MGGYLSDHTPEGLTRKLHSSFPLASDDPLVIHSAHPLRALARTHGTDTQKGMCKPRIQTLDLLLGESSLGGDLVDLLLLQLQLRARVAHLKEAAGRFVKFSWAGVALTRAGPPLLALV